MANARRDLILISDFQRSDWEPLASEAVDRIRRQLGMLPVPPALTLMQVGREIEDNVSIEGVSFSRKALGVGQDLQIRANLRNHGAKSHANARVLFRVNERQHAVSQVTLNGNATSQVLFTHQFSEPGSHVLEVEVAVDDRLKTDNRFAAAVNVLDRIPVLLVDGAPSSAPLEGETDFLSVALTPFTFGRLKLSDLIDTRTLSAREFSKESLQEARVVVLANVPQMTREQVTLVTEYVQGGGSALVFVGNRIDVDWYNRTLREPAGEFLPMRIAELQGSLNEAAESTRIVAQFFEHPALEIFNDRANGNLADAEIRRWYRLSRTSDGEGEDVEPAREIEETKGQESRRPAERGLSGSDDAPLVIARLETGDPLMVERRVGAGLVVLVATSCDADWSNLPMRPSYVPLMQQLVTTMAARVTPPNNVRTGEPLVAMLPADAQGLPLSLATPDGSRHTVRPVKRGTHSAVEFHGSQQPGVYTLTGPDAQAIHFVAETSRSESELRLLDAEQLESLAEDLGADLVSSGEEFVELDRTRRHGREVWRFCFWGLMGLMCMELFLQQRFARVRR